MYWLAVIFIAQVACAQSSHISIRGRALVDLSYSGYEPERNSRMLYTLEDLRLGVKGSYERMNFTFDIGLGGNKVAVKDLLFCYSFKNSFISVGNGYEPFSMEMIISTLDMYFHQPATSTAAFGDGRKLGMSYNFHHDRLYFATGLYLNNDINVKIADASDAVVSTSRLLFRWSKSSLQTFHIGGAYSYTSAESSIGDVDPSRTISSKGVAGYFGENVVYAELEDIGAESKVGLEFLTMFSKWRVQGEYFFNWHTTGTKMYKPHGGYIQAGILLIGKDFKYDSQYAVASRPASSRALELTLRYNSTNLNDDNAQIYGGQQQDFSIGLNYYINDHFAVKLNESYMIADEHCNPFYQKNMFITQLRVQCKL